MDKLYVVNENKVLHPNTKEIKYYINENNCHICVSHRLNHRGYPTKNFNGISSTMSRYIWYLNTGKILETQEHILHRCDNPQCINFEHLFLGSNDDNVQDKVSKGRQARHSMISDEVILKIKKDIIHTSEELSKVYGISSSMVRKIWNEETHKYLKVENYDGVLKDRKNRPRKTKFSEKQIEYILTSNKSSREVANELGYGKTSILRIRGADKYA